MAQEQLRIGLVERRRAGADGAVEIADNLDSAPDFVRDERQNLPQKPGEAAIIGVIGAGDDDEIVPPAPGAIGGTAG